MRYSVLKEHIQHFQTEGSVGFEEFLPEGVFASLKLNLANLAVKHDLWRLNPALERRWGHPHFVDPAKEIIETKSLRLAWDQLVLPGEKKNASLEEISPVEGILGGWILHMGDKSIESETILPKNPCDALFVSPEAIIPWEDATEPLLVVVYAAKYSSCRIKPELPHSQIFKGLGYVDGESLHDQLHPIVGRYS